MRRPYTADVVWVAAITLGTLILSSCADSESFQAPPDPVDESRMLVESQLPIFEDVMRQAGRQKAIRDAMAAQIEAESQRRFQDRVDDGLRYSTVFRREYLEGQLAPIFVDEWGITWRGAEALSMLDDHDRHALEVETLHEEQIEILRQRFDDLGEPDPVDGGFEPTVEEVEALVELVARKADANDGEVGSGALISAVSEVDETQGLAELERFRAYNRREAEAFKKSAHVLAAMELFIADASLRYARKMRHKNLKRVDWREMRELGGSTEVILGRMQGTLRDMADADTSELAQVFVDLEPSHPQYAALLAASDRYRKFVDDGGWAPVTSFQVETDARSRHVAALRQRLEAEGFEASPDDVADDEIFDPEVVDESLIEGIRAYQRTHQFVDDGRPTPGFWRSINISAEDRLAQIELTLRRWRQSYFEDDRDFIMVNIPSFEAQVWTDAERQMQFDVVVGRNQRRCDRDERRWKYPDATPVLMSTMDHIMFNPAWYVPNRLVREVLEPEVEDNPDYFEEEGYEEVELADGTRAVRQLPGEDNALGVAKFIFPNEHNVYLHDTPQKHYFDYGIRAFSHGCVRVSKPVELAKFLVQWEGRSDFDVDEILAGERTIRFDFDRELPVIVEYYTVWVDEHGDPHFLADIYQKDARQLADDPEAFSACEPSPPPSPDVVESDEEDRGGPDDIEEVELDDVDDQDEPDGVDLDLGP